MIDSDNVLLLHAPVPAAAFRSEPARPAVGEKRTAARIIANIYYLNSGDADAATRFERDALPKLRASGIPVLAWFTSETAANNYPRLPVREGERVLVWFTRFQDDAEYEARKGAIESAAAGLSLAGKPEVLRLEPTERSELR
jgi:hypothetical protein